MPWDARGTMTKKIIIGHPDPAPERYVRALTDAYSRGAEEGGHTARVVDIATLDFPLLRSQAECKSAPLPVSLNRDFPLAVHF